jgi:hypothetical protein
MLTDHAPAQTTQLAQLTATVLCMLSPDGDTDHYVFIRNLTMFCSNQNHVTRDFTAQRLIPSPMLRKILVQVLSIPVLVLVQKKGKAILVTGSGES